MAFCCSSGDPLFFCWPAWCLNSNAPPASDIGVSAGAYADADDHHLIITLVRFCIRGFSIPIPSLKPVAYGWRTLMPAVYYTRIAVGCFLKGVGLTALWAGVIDFAGYACALFALGYRLSPEAIGMNRDDLACYGRCACG